MMKILLLIVELIQPTHCPFLWEAIERTKERMVHCEQTPTDVCASDRATLAKLREWSRRSGCDLPSIWSKTS